MDLSRSLARSVAAAGAAVLVSTVLVGCGSDALTTKEFSVLEHLVLRAGEVVSKAEILEHVWDFAYDGDPNIVEVYVSTLRRKLGAGRIVTLRGAGYRL